MALTNFLALTVFLLIVIFLHFSPTNSKIFREYIGAEWNGVKFTDVPINSNVEFHFILSFAIDYTSSSATPTNGLFNIFWDDNLTPSDVVAIKQSNSNVKVALSIGGDQVDGQNAYFNPTSVSSWVSNAVTSLTTIIKEYNLDGIDIDYEHFKSDTSTFTQCIGQLITTLKNSGVISFASIAPFAEPEVQNNYKALWSQYGSIIDYVNYQFYAYDSDTTVSQFLGYFDDQTANFNGGKILASFATDRTSGGLGPQNGFFSACGSLKRQGKLYGIFVWSADDSLVEGFQYEKRAQLMLAST